MEFRQGDRVRLTIEGAVESIDGEDGIYIHGNWFQPSCFTDVEVIAAGGRAENPAEDPIGTLRSNSGPEDPFIKIGPDSWALYEDKLSIWTDEKVSRRIATRPIIGFVPGTPAARAQRAPRVFNYGDPIPEDVLQVRSAEMGSAYRFGTGWLWVESREKLETYEYGDEWPVFHSYQYPLTEVFE